VTTKTKQRTRRRKTSHLKIVPETRQLRELLRKQCADVAQSLDRNHPLSKDQMEQVARQMLNEHRHPEGYLGWAMVTLASEFWREQVAAVPHSQRLFLLPHCLKHAEGCPADYDDFGLDCRRCGACSIADFRTRAEDLGYKVLVAEGSPIVLKIIVSGHVDAICGVACLNVLEKAIDRILLAGIPCMAVPLLSSDCRNTSVDEDWVTEMVNVPHVPVQQKTSTYVHLMRGASRMFGEELETLAPRQRDATGIRDGSAVEICERVEPIAATEAIAYDFLAKGGKHARPFITLAAYDALRGGHATESDGDARVRDLPQHIKRPAMAIEAFHKASLVHDDIEDDDEFRYGDAALHRKYGVPTAINVGDYLIGFGYRLVSRDAVHLGGDTAAQILDLLADAHQRLSEGQGAELIWRDARDKRLQPIDALKIYALKTSPAFEAAFFTGIALAGKMEEYREPIKQFARNLGVAFQILNDLKDWQGDTDNKMLAGADLLGGRPTLLWALALESLSEPLAGELSGLIDNYEQTPEQRLNRARYLYHEAGVFEKAHKLVDKHQARAEQVADEIEPLAMRRLLYYLVDTVLERPSEPIPFVQLGQPGLGDALPVSN